jgi:hypothetical protein
VTNADQPRVLTVIVCGAGPASAVGTLVMLAHDRGWTVQVITTPAALDFLDQAAVAKQTGNPVRSQYRKPGEPRSRQADAIIVAPATYNTINKWAHGISDTYALGILAETTGLAVPIVVLPFVNSAFASRPRQPGPDHHRRQRKNHHPHPDERRPPRRSNVSSKHLRPRLDRDIPAHTPDSWSVCGSLLLRGAITAAQRSNPATAHELLNEADDAARRLGVDGNLRWTAFDPINTRQHRVNIAVVFGDAGTAIDVARGINLDKINVTERKASLLIDTARAFLQWGKHEKAYIALRAWVWVEPRCERPEESR